MRDEDAPGKRRSLGRDTLHQAAVAGEHVGVVVEQREVVLVEGGAEVGLGDGEADGVGEALAERAGRDLDTLGDAELRVARGDRVELTELQGGKNRRKSAEELSSGAEKASSWESSDAPS